MKRILVVQTTRMGDVLQTTPLIRAIRGRYPDAHIAVLIRDMGQSIAAMDPDIDEVRVYNEDGMFNNMRAKDSERLLKAYYEAREYIQWVRDQKFDVAYNCTNSISSAMLLKLAEVPRVVGADMSDDWHFVLRGRWVNYFFTSVFHRDFNDLNLCDISGRFAEDAEPARQLVMEVPPGVEPTVQQLLARHHVKPDDFIVCFQLGASEPSKRWSELNFARLGRLLVEQYKARIFLLGVKAEAPLGESFEQHAPGLAVPLYGETSIAEVAGLLQRARLLVTNDTGTMHIAAAVNCPVMLTSVGYVHFRETGPYGAGHCAIERHKVRLGRTDIDSEQTDERTLLQPEQVFAALQWLLSHRDDEQFPQLDDDEMLADVDIHTTRFAPDGCLEWYPVIHRPMREVDFIRIAYRAMWLEYMESHRDKGAERASLELLVACYDLDNDDRTDGWRKAMTTAFASMASMARQGIKTTEDLMEALSKGRIDRAKQLVKELVRLDEELRIHGEVYPACKPLSVTLRFERDNLEGMDPQDLAKRTLQIYRDCFARARLMEKKTDQLGEVCCNE